MTANQISATYASIATLQADYLTANQISAAYASIATLEANYLTANQIAATYASIATLQADYLTANQISAAYASIATLEANYLTASQIAADYLTVNLANITQAGFEKIFSNTLVSEYAVLQDGTVTGELKAVNINGDLITAGTIIADRIVISGENGLYYQLNLNGNGDLTQEQLSDPELQNALHGSNIVAKSITADQIAASTITSNEIAANTIQAGNIAAGAITTTELAAGSVSSAQIQADAILASHIKAGEITVDKLNSTFTEEYYNMQGEVSTITNSIDIDAEDELIEIKSSATGMSMRLTSSQLSFILNNISRLAWLDAEEGLGASEVSIGPSDTWDGNSWVSNIGNRWRITVSDDGSRLRFSRHNRSNNQ